MRMSKPSLAFVLKDEEEDKKIDLEFLLSLLVHLVFSSHNCLRLM